MLAVELRGLLAPSGLTVQVTSPSTCWVNMLTVFPHLVFDSFVNRVRTSCSSCSVSTGLVILFKFFPPSTPQGNFQKGPSGPSPGKFLGRNFSTGFSVTPYGAPPARATPLGGLVCLGGGISGVETGSLDFVLAGQPGRGLEVILVDFWVPIWQRWKLSAGLASGSAQGFFGTILCGGVCDARIGPALCKPPGRWVAPGPQFPRIVIGATPRRGPPCTFTQCETTARAGR